MSQSRKKQEQSHDDDNESVDGADPKVRITPFYILYFEVAV